MHRKKQDILISAALALCFLLSGCGGHAPASSAAAVPQENAAATPGPSAAPATVPMKVTIQLDYEYVRARLEDNRLQITILGDKSDGMMLDYWNKVRFDEPYEVSGLTGTYTDMFIGTIGQDTWPYVFLLTDAGTVECVPIADPLYEPYYTGAGTDIPFQSIGVLPGVTDVVSFREGNVEEENGGYVTVFAECADGAVCNLRFSLIFLEEPEEIPASEDDSLRMLAENTEIAPLIEQGMKPWNTGEFRYLYGEYGRLFSLGADRKQQLARKQLYGVCASGAIYSYNDYAAEWVPANDLAALYRAGDSYSDLFVILTDPDDPVYQQFKDTAEFINTSVVGLENTEPVLLVPLKTNLHLQVDLMADPLGDSYTEAADIFFDGTVSRQTPCLIGVTLSETNSALRVTARWYDGFDDLVAVWYATYNQGSPLYTQYVSGEYFYPPNG